MLQDEFGLDIPDWAKSIYPNQTEESFRGFIASRMGTIKLKRLLGGEFIFYLFWIIVFLFSIYLTGFLFKKIIDDTDKKINGPLDAQGKKIYIYSGHDITLSTFFSILDIWNRTTPAVASYILIEVHNINGTHGFKVRISLNCLENSKSF